MVLEEITKEVTDAESNAENRKQSLSGASAERITPEQLSARPVAKSSRGTSDGTIASTIPCRRRRSRSSLDLTRRLSTDDASGAKEKRHRATSTPPTALEDFTSRQDVTPPHRGSERKGGGLFALLAAVREDENEFPDGFAMEEGVAFDDVRLHHIHDRWRAEEHQGVALNVLMNDYSSEDLKASFLKFLDSVVGYVLYFQRPSQIGVTSGVPLDGLIALWVVPEYQNRGHEQRLMHWWLRTAVRGVKYFTVQQMTPSVKGLLHQEGFKVPKTTTGDDQPNYIAMI